MNSKYINKTKDALQISLTIDAKRFCETVFNNELKP